MDKLYYENQGSYTYLVYEIGDQDVVDSMTIGMLTNNKIPGLAQALFTQMDASRFIKYNVSAKVSAKQFFTGTVNKKRLVGVFLGIVDAILSAEDYMIDPDTIMLDLDYIFTDVSTCETILICLPVTDVDAEERDYRLFFRNIMFTLQFDQTENCDYEAQLINYLNRTSGFSLIEFRELLAGIKKNTGRAQAQPQQIAQPSAGQFMQNQQFGGAQSAQQPQYMGQQLSAATQPARQSQYMGQQLSAATQPVRQPQYMGQQSVKGNSAPQQFGNMQVPQYAGQPKVSKQQNAKGMAIPGQQPGQAAVPEASGEKEISWFYLMQHYNKENAALYKAQKERKKDNLQQPDADAKHKKKDKKNQGNYAVPQIGMQNNGGFAVPQAGPQNNSGFAVPQTGALNNGGFAVPQTGALNNGGFAVPQTGALNNGGFAVPQAGNSVASKNGSQSGGFTVPGAPQPSANTSYQIQGGANASQQPFVTGPEAEAHDSAPQTGSGPMGAPMNFGDTTVLSSGKVGETTVLHAGMQEQQSIPQLIREKNKEKVLVDKPVFRIGKERSYVDYFISDNTAISRSHANIVTREGKYYITDTNSTNHTFVDGMMIQSNQEIEIIHGTKIRLANEEFEFRLF